MWGCFCELCSVCLWAGVKRRIRSIISPSPPSLTRKRAGKAQDERKERGICSSGANPFMSRDNLMESSSTVCRDELSGSMKAEACHRGMLLPLLHRPRKRWMCAHELRGSNYWWPEKTQDPGVLPEYSYKLLPLTEAKAIRKLATRSPTKKTRALPFTRSSNRAAFQGMVFAKAGKLLSKP